MFKKGNNIDNIDDNLWLGNLSAAKDIKDLKEKGITKILTIMEKDFPEYKSEDGFVHKRIELIDYIDQNIIKFFGECLNFIKGDEKVLVHCQSGASRSATIVIAYLMWNKKMKYMEASKYVKEKRFIVFPNPGFREQLKMFEKLLIKNDYDIQKINFDTIEWDVDKVKLGYS